MSDFKVKEFRLNNCEDISLGNLNVIIGPNSSGKSQILRDLYNYCNGKNNLKIVGNVNLDYPKNSTDLVDNNFYTNFFEEDRILYDYNNNPISAADFDLDLEMLYYDQNTSAEEAEIENQKLILSRFGGYFSQILGTRERLGLLDQREISAGANQILSSLYDHNESVDIEKTLNDLVRDCFKTEIKLDFTDRATFLFRVGSGISTLAGDPRKSRGMLRNFPRLDDEGDGLKSFVATVLTICMKNSAVLFIDEPEAFLHPPQCYKLGQLIARIDSDQQIFISTHSAELLKGILNHRNKHDVKIIRVDRKSNQSYSTFLNPEDIDEILMDPRLNTEKILKGLFYRGVVIGESESDALFYSKVSNKMGRDADIYYTNAQNKQTIGKVAFPYIRLGIPTVGIFDFDILRNWDDLKRILSAFNVKRSDIDSIQDFYTVILKEIPSNTKMEINDLLVKVNQIYHDLTKEEWIDEEKVDRFNKHLEDIKQLKSPWKKVKALGIDGLTITAKMAFTEIDNICRANGLFIVPTGELESMLKEYEIGPLNNKKNWLFKALEKIPDLPVDEEKLPFKFIKAIDEYIFCEENNEEINLDFNEIPFNLGGVTDV